MSLRLHRHHFCYSRRNMVDMAVRAMIKNMVTWNPRTAAPSPSIFYISIYPNLTKSYNEQIFWIFWVLYYISTFNTIWATRVVNNSSKTWWSCIVLYPVWWKTHIFAEQWMPTINKLCSIQPNQSRTPCWTARHTNTKTGKYYSWNFLF